MYLGFMDDFISPSNFYGLQNTAAPERSSKGLAGTTQPGKWGASFWIKFHARKAEDE